MGSAAIPMLSRLAVRQFEFDAQAVLRNSKHMTKIRALGAEPRDCNFIGFEPIGMWTRKHLALCVMYLHFCELPIPFVA